MDLKDLHSLVLPELMIKEEEHFRALKDQKAQTAHWQKTPTAQGALRLLVQYQACDDSRCLPPAELRYSMPLEGE